MEDLSEFAIDRARHMGAEYADLRMEMATGTTITVMDGRTKNMISPEESGCGIRVFRKGAWGFSVTNALTKTALRSAVDSAVRMAKVAERKVKVLFSIGEQKPVRKVESYPCKEPPGEVRADEKLSFALSLDDSMKSHDPRITSTNVRYDDFEGQRVIANSFGSCVVTHEVWTFASCVAWAKSQGVVQQGHDSLGAVSGFELARQASSQGLGDRAASQAVRLLASSPAPAGTFTCVLDNRMTGLLAHEAMGHACEADLVLAGSSVLEGRQGELVADESISLYDDPTVKGSFGYFSYDWEGVKARKHTLIDHGVLKEFMHNLESGSRMGIASNGAARAETYSDRPVVRMSNTYIGGGDRRKDELIGDLKNGLLIMGGQYGYVEPAKGQFMFKCDEAYEIRRGEIGKRYRDVSLSGLILDVLKNVVAVGDDVVLGDAGLCGKADQSARTTDGGPHICVSGIVVGGLA